MNIKTKKLKNGFEIPEYGLGTWQMGGRDDRDLKNDDRADIEAIKRAITEGVTYIDTRGNEHFQAESKKARD